MTLRSGIILCAVITGLSGLTLCQPPRPRIAGVPIPSFPMVANAATQDILIASRQAERVIQAYETDGPLVHEVSRIEPVLPTQPIFP